MINYVRLFRAQQRFLKSWIAEHPELDVLDAGVRGRMKREWLQSEERLRFLRKKG